ncbi:hypothetical protein [Zhongshania aliphaticivorans]|jgi:hypothetical protein|uniref:hypothetical protein n=1 Tax=Zhongshania aliphaticivorans TaxID=1470434 RepID=UPI0039C96DE4
MLKKLLPYSTIAAALMTASSIVNAQSLGPLQAITDTFVTLGGGAELGTLSMDGNESDPFNEQQKSDAVSPAQSTTEDNGLHSSPIFNVLPNNPFVIAYSAIIDGPENALIVSDFLQGNLILKSILSGLPGGEVIRSSYKENAKSSKPETPSDGFIDSQL